MWGVYELKPDQSYHCERCDVYGKGPDCWLCGRSDNLVHATAPDWTNWHRRDTSERDILVGEGTIHIARELDQLLTKDHLKG